jgi:putative membrane protein
MNNEEINRSDWLALERTRLANERTFLAYFRTFVVVFASGLTIIKVEILHNIVILGYTFLTSSLFLLLIGVLRFFFVRKRVKKYFKRMNET